jgi:hypothetical protein
MLARWSASRCRQHAREMTSLAVPSACSRGGQPRGAVSMLARWPTASRCRQHAREVVSFAASRLTIGPRHLRLLNCRASSIARWRGVGGTRRGGKRFALVTTPSRTRVGPRTTWLRQRLDAHAAVLGLRRPRSLDHASFFFRTMDGCEGPRSGPPGAEAQGGRASPRPRSRYLDGLPRPKEGFEALRGGGATRSREHAGAFTARSAPRSDAAAFWAPPPPPPRSLKPRRSHAAATSQPRRKASFQHRLHPSRS